MSKLGKDFKGAVGVAVFECELKRVRDGKVAARACFSRFLTKAFENVSDKERSKMAKYIVEKGLKGHKKLKAILQPVIDDYPVFAKL